jgi:ketosteroid isomerase-like protein
MGDEALQQLLDRWSAAESANDAAAVGRLLATEFVGVGPAGFVLDADGWVGRFAGGLVNRSFAVVETEVHGHGAAAVIVGVVDQQTSFAGQDISGRFRLTLTAVEAPDGWRLASLHLGPLRPAPAGSAARPQ